MPALSWPPMQIRHLRIANFKGFAQQEILLHPQFNLLVGENGSGKTSVLDALSIAAGSWFLGIRGQDSRHIRTEDVRVLAFETASGVNWEAQYPCAIGARGCVQGAPVSWERTLNGPEGRTTYGGAREIKDIASDVEARVRKGDSVTLPLISYYGTGRLWNVPREQALAAGDKLRLDRQSRLAGYRNSVDPRLSVAELVSWFAQQAWLTFQQNGEEPPSFAPVRRALVRNVKEARDVYFDAKLSEVVVDFGFGDRKAFNNLSDGQRCMLALVGDIAQKAARLNPHLGESILDKTPGVVLIDELDLHLHPKWQRHVVEDLRNTFPSIQFICTTHSPFLIQSLRSGEELVVLDGQPSAHLGDMSIEQIARGIQGVENTAVSARYEQMKQVARSFLEDLESTPTPPEQKLAEYKARLASLTAPYADNPAFQAFLELKLASKFGQ